MEDLHGLKITTVRTMKHWDRTASFDVVAKAAMSCRLEGGDERG
jgi:hypothetical protein